MMGILVRLGFVAIAILVGSIAGNWKRNAH